MKRVLLPIAILASCISFAGYLFYTPITVEEAVPEVNAVTVRVARVRLSGLGLR